MNYADDDYPLAPMATSQQPFPIAPKMPRYASSMPTPAIAPLQRGASVEIAQQNARHATTSANNNTWNALKSDPQQMGELVRSAAGQRIRDLQMQINGYGKSAIGGQSMNTPEQLAAWKNELAKLQSGDHSSIANDEGYLRTIAAPRLNQQVALMPVVQRTNQLAVDARLAGAQGMPIAPFRRDRAQTDQIDTITNLIYPGMARKMDAETGLIGARTGQVAQATERDRSILPTDAAIAQEKLKQMQTVTPYIGPRSQAEIDAIKNKPDQISRKDHEAELGKRDKQLSELQRQNRILMDKLAKYAGDPLRADAGADSSAAGGTGQQTQQQQKAPDGQPVTRSRTINGRQYNQSASGRWFDALTQKEVNQ